MKCICGFDNEREAYYCANCGKALEAAAPVAAATPEPSVEGAVMASVEGAAAASAEKPSESAAASVDATVSVDATASVDAAAQAVSATSFGTAAVPTTLSTQAGEPVAAAPSMQSVQATQPVGANGAVGATQAAVQSTPMASPTPTPTPTPAASGAYPYHGAAQGAPQGGAAQPRWPHGPHAPHQAGQPGAPYGAGQQQPYYGQQYGYPPPPPRQPPQPFSLMDVFVITAFVLAIVGFFVYAVILIPASIAFSVVVWQRKVGRRTNNLAVVALIVGLCAAVIRIATVLSEIITIPPWLSGGVFGW